MASTVTMELSVYETEICPGDRLLRARNASVIIAAIFSFVNGWWHFQQSMIFQRTFYCRYNEEDEVVITEMLTIQNLREACWSFLPSNQFTQFSILGNVKG